MGSWIMKCTIVLVFLFNICVCTTALKIQDLNGKWRVQNTEKGYNLSATVPGGVYSDLMQNNIIEDIFYGYNDIDTRWISKINWNYSRSFTVTEDLLAHNNINLVFDGIDTFSKIIINGHEIGTTDNMFVRYIFDDVKSYLQIGNNDIVVQFASPVNAAKSLFEKQAETYIVPPKCVPSKYNGECHVNHIRKMQASFSWDWGPAFPSVGIWKNVYLEAYNSSVLRDITINTSLNTNCWDMEVKTYLGDNSKNVIQGTLVVEMLTDKENITKTYEINTTENKYGDFLVTYSFSIPKSHVQLWWPNGYGKAKLYNIKVSFLSLDKYEKSTKTLRIGFRTVELIQDVIDNTAEEKGRTFYFKINNVRIFAKGSNSIPVNILPELGKNETTVKFLLQSAKDVHMNMLRVWGGGTYESNYFYELADEMGILIWQDFMFACSMYPTNNDFLSTVVSEVKHQVRRLQHHPSIVLWAGNNENEVALRSNWYGTLKNFKQYKRDYIKLYVDTIKEEVLRNDNTRPYLTSSPTNGIQSEQEEYVAVNPQNRYYGDVHFYKYTANSWNRKIYPISRFASEYGYQSMPSIETLLTATNDTKDLSIDSSFLKSRQHHMLGYSKMEVLISYQLQLPSKSSSNFYKAFIFYSQIIQAMAVKTETEYYRQWRSNTDDSGKGLTMGALYWQLNDVWAAPSWAGIDFKNKWKMLHYYAKKFFAPIIVTGDLNTHKNQLDIYVVSDLMATITNVTLIVGVYTWQSFTPVKEDIIYIDILPEASSKVKTYILDEHLSPCGNDAEKNCFIYFTLKNNSGLVAPENYAFPVPLKSARLQRPELEISAIKQNYNTAQEFIIEIKTTAPALFVWLDAKNIHGHFSENGFLQPTSTKSVHFYADQPTTVAQLQKCLTFTHLLDKEYL